METLRCTVKKLYRGGQKPDGWFGCFARARGYSETIQLTGVSVVRIEEGMTLEAEGNWTEKNGWRSFTAKRVTVIPDTQRGVLGYFSSRHFPGIGRTIASKLWSTYGSSAFSVIQQSPSDVQEALGLTDLQIQTLVRGVAVQTVENQLQKWLPGLSENAAKRIKKLWKDPVAVIMDNPYCLCQVPGISFSKADGMALSAFHIDPMSDLRIENGMKFYLDTELSGDMYLNLSDVNSYTCFLNGVNRLLRLSLSMVDMQKRILDIDKNEGAVKLAFEHHEWHLYPRNLWTAQADILDYLKPGKTGRRVPDRYIGNYEQTHRVLTDEQKQAVRAAVQNKVSIITGGPGRGKTCAIDCICYVWEHYFDGSAVLLAPTGKATNRVKQETGREAQTLARWFLTGTHQEYSSSTMFIIDEASMVGVEDAAMLMRHVGSAHVVFVGDVCQLPSVSAGSFFGDLVKSDCIPTTYLTQNLRSSEFPLIEENAVRINQGDVKLKLSPYFMFLPQSGDDDVMVSYIVDQYKEYKRNGDEGNIAILCAMNKGKCGVKQLNIAIQSEINPKSDRYVRKYDNKRGSYYFDDYGFSIPGMWYHASGDCYTQFHIGDRVMQVVNVPDVLWGRYPSGDYDDTATDTGVGVYNGDCGTIIRFVPADDDNSAKVVVLTDDFRVYSVEEENFDQLTMGYVYTVHKAQGSEYKHVLYVSPFAMEYTPDGFACRNLFYTAVTRAKESVYIVGSKSMVDRCIKNPSPDRLSMLSQLLSERL